MRWIRIVIASLWVLALAPGVLAQTFAPPPSVEGCPGCKALRDSLDDIPRAVEQIKVKIARLDQEEQAYRKDLAARGASPGEHDRASEFAKRRRALQGEIFDYDYRYRELLRQLEICLQACRAPASPPPVTQVPTPQVLSPSQQMLGVWESASDGGAWLAIGMIFETMFPDDFGESPPNEETWTRMRAEQLTTTSLCRECDPLIPPVQSALAALAGAKARLAAIPKEIHEIERKLREVRAVFREVRDAVEKLQQQYPEAGDTTARTAFLREMRLIEARTAEPVRQFDSLMNARRALKAEQSSLEARLLALEDAVEAAKDALALCNGRCEADLVSLDRVVGYLGINPFNPSGRYIETHPINDSGPAGFIQFTSPSFSGGEGGVVPIFVTRGGGSKGAVTVAYATRPGTASAADFGATSGTLSWADGDTTLKTFSVVLVDDTLVEGPETFAVELSNPTGGATLGNFSGAIVTIVDNDSPGLPPQAGNIQFATSTFSVMENAGAATIMVTRTGGSAGEVTVQVFTGPGSATAGTDYQAVAGVLTWAAGDTGVKTFTVPIVNDTLVEGPETFFVTLGNPTGQATLGAPATATVTIVDDDVNTGPCGATANAWTPNAGSYACSGSCSPNPSPRLSVNGDIVTATSFASGGTATFQGCGSSLNSRETNLTYFGQSNHRATITRMSDTNFAANIVSSGGGTCAFTCNRTGP